MKEIENRSPATIDNYSSVRGTVNVNVDYCLDGEGFREAQDALLSLVERAASRVKVRTNYARSHSSGVVTYVGQTTNQQIRQPDHAWGRLTTHR